MSLYFLYHAWFSHNYFYPHSISFHFSTCFVSDITGLTYKTKFYCIFLLSRELAKLRPGQIPRHGVLQRRGVFRGQRAPQEPQIGAFGRNQLKFGPRESFGRSGLLASFQLIPIM